MKSTGCELIITKQCPFSNFKSNFVRLAKKLSRKEKGFYVDQFFNKVNYLTHYNETGPEIYRDLLGKIDCFVCSSGTNFLTKELVGQLEVYRSSLKKRIRI